MNEQKLQSLILSGLRPGCQRTTMYEENTSSAMTGSMVSAVASCQHCDISFNASVRVIFHQVNNSVVALHLHAIVMKKHGPLETLTCSGQQPDSVSQTISRENTGPPRMLRQLAFHPVPAHTEKCFTLRRSLAVGNKCFEIMSNRTKRRCVRRLG